MKRREFITFLGGATAWPLAARAQQSGPPAIGYLSSRSAEAEAAVRTPFLKALADAGFVAGQNVSVEYRFAEGHYDRLRELAADLIRKQVSVLVATDRPAAVAAKAATSTIPIVFTSGNDPVREGLVKSLNYPGGNATGVYLFTSELGSKRLGLIRELLAKPSLIAFVADPNSTSSPQQVEDMQSAAKTLEQPLLVLRAGTEREIEETFAAMARQKVSAVVYGASPFYQVISARLIELAARHKIPACYEWRDPVVAGGLMSYNTNRDEFGRQIGNYTAQILKGAKPGDLPVVLSSKFIFVINLTAAKTLGLTIPPALLARADEVIE
jgi:putative ABC transport system substrate-binding protein